MSATAKRLIIVQLRIALACVFIALTGGVVSALHYVPAVSARLNALSLTLPRLRPIHTTFATAWIFSCGIAVVYSHLARSGSGLDAGDVRRFWFHTIAWLATGLGILVSLLAGVSSGREYLEFHPAFSLPLAAGWAAFAWSFLKRWSGGFWRQPVYVYMWSVSALLFLHAFAEAHLWLLPSVRANVVRDLQIQWKSCGTLVGSFNFLVYGTLAYVRERVSGDERGSQSTLSFVLFGVGCLNSFTNYAHHTYHVPQSHLVKWISFVVSMSEIVILWFVVHEVVQAMRRARSSHAALVFIESGRVWTAVMLAVAMVISVPPWNAVIHGTTVVAAHAMGSEIGIDSMLLFGAIAWLLRDQLAEEPALQLLVDVAARRWRVHALNLSCGALVAWLAASGLATGLSRLHGVPAPAWVIASRWVFPVAGSVAVASLVCVLWPWVRVVARLPVFDEGRRSP